MRSRTRSRRAGARTRSPTRLKAKATEILDKLKGGTTLAELATAEGLKVETQTGIKRGEPSPPAVGGRDRGGLPHHQGRSRQRRGRRSRPSRSCSASPTSSCRRPTRIAEATKQAQDALNRALSDDIFGEYIARLQDEIGVTINQTALRQVITGVSRPRRRQLSSVMQIEPQAAAFAKRYARGEAQVVWTTLVADLETPVSAFLKIAGGRPMSFLLESVEGGAVRGRYSIIGLDPDLIWRTVAGRAEINRAPRVQPTASRLATRRRSPRCAR